MIRGRASGSSRARGLLVARILSGSWRTPPPPLDLTEEELSLATPALHRSGCSGAAWRRIEATPLRDLPDARLLHDGFVYHTLRVKLLERDLAAVFPRLAERGVEGILAKGWAMARHYPLAGLRPYGDLDILVQPASLERAREALATWEGVPPPVEWHTGFNELADRSWDVLRSRARQEDLLGVAIRILAPEDHFRLLALHALEHGLSRPMWLCDLALLLESLPGAFDWDRCLEGEAWEVDGLRCAVGLSEELLGVDLTGAGVPRRLTERPMPAWVVPAALSALGAPEHYLTAGVPEEQLFSPRALVHAARLRWANPIEVTFRLRAPWDRGSRLPLQVEDYLLRSGRVLTRIPGHLAWLWRNRGGEPSSAP